MLAALARLALPCGAACLGACHRRRLFLFFSLALYVTVLFEATRIQCNDDDDGNETTRSRHLAARRLLLLVFDEGREHEMFVRSFVGKKETISPYLTPSLPTGL